MTNVGANSRFLQSTLKSNNLASETTLKNIEDELSGGIVVSGTVGVSSLPTPVDIQTNGLVDKVQCAIDQADITGAIPVSVGSMTLTDVNTGGSQTNDLNVRLTNAERFKILNPTQLYRSTFATTTQFANDWDVNLVLSGTHTIAVLEKASKMNITLNSADTVQITTKKNFDCSGYSNILFCTVTPWFFSVPGAFNDQVKISLIGDVPTDDITFMFRGDGTYFVEAKSISALNSAWNINTTFLGSGANLTSTIVIEFNEHTISFGQVWEGKIRYLHRIDNDGSYNSFPTYSQRRIDIQALSVAGASPAWETRINSVKLYREGGIERPISLGFYAFYNSANIVNGTATIAYTGIRYNSGGTDPLIPAKVLSFSYGPNGNTKDWAIFLVKNPVIGGVKTWNSYTNSACEYLSGIATNTISGGQILHGLYTTNRGGQGGNEVKFEYDLVDNDELIVGVQALQSQTGRALINWKEG